MVKAYSSLGSFTFDPISGEVFISELASEMDTPIRVDIAEYKRYYGTEFNEGVDILDIGYWIENGSYVPAENDWREEKKQLLLDNL
jgi:hypothetical protein